MGRDVCDVEEKLFRALQDTCLLLIPDLLVFFSCVLSVQSLFCVGNKSLFILPYSVLIFS